MKTDTTRRGLLALGGVAAASLALPAKALASVKNYMVSAIPGNKILVSGCVVRFSNADGSPTFHANGAHLAAGVESVRVNPSNGRLQVIQTVRGAAANPVIFAFAQADETLAGRGIMIGASGGTDDTEYVFYDTKLGHALDLRKQSHRMRLQGKNSNCWLGWVHAPVSMR